ncbi:MAG: metalloregulator ArsR/SmtB family transcription factor [Opitutaceae bacterium]
MKLINLYLCLSDNTRLRLINLLAQRPLCVCHFEALLRLPQTKISRHLAYLRRHGLVTTKQSGLWRIYALATPLSPALVAHLHFLQDAIPEEPLLRRDLAKLTQLASHLNCDCAPIVPRRKFLHLAR